MVVARRNPGGMVSVLARRAVAIPAALRHRCGLRAGDLMLLAALAMSSDPCRRVSLGARRQRRDVRSALQLRVYRCPVGLGWHLTSRRARRPPDRRPGRVPRHEPRPPDAGTD
ncbi:MAG: hypothetical protein WAK82_42605 [Streptosporangiaceae bacterium]